MAKTKNKFRVKKLFNGREFDLTAEQLEKWKAGKIKFSIIQTPVKVEDIPDVLKEEEPEIKL